MENRTCGEQCAILLENIAWLRKYYGISKTRMVKLLGIGLHSLNKMEKGEMPPKLKLDVLIRIHRRVLRRSADISKRRMPPKGAHAFYWCR